MRELENRQKFKRRLYSLPALMALLAITVLLVKGAYSIMLTERESSREAKLLALDVATLAEREKVLEEAIQKLETEEGIEEEIKSKYNVAREGERVAVIVDRPSNIATTTQEEKSWFKRMWTAIIGK